MKNKVSLIKLTFSGILATAAVLSFLLENLFPPLFIPGARMGLSNVFILLAAILLGNAYAFAVLTVKITVGSLFSGNVSAVLYSLPAGIFSLTIQILLLRFTERFSVIAISVTGAVLNTTVQNTIFCIVTGTAEYFAYLPYLALIGVLSGITVGLAVYFAIKYLPKTLTDKLISKEQTTED